VAAPGDGLGTDPVIAPSVSQGLRLDRRRGQGSADVGAGASRQSQRHDGVTAWIRPAQSRGAWPLPRKVRERTADHSVQGAFSTPAFVRICRSAALAASVSHPRLSSWGKQGCAADRFLGGRGLTPLLLTDAPRDPEPRPAARLAQSFHLLPEHLDGSTGCGHADHRRAVSNGAFGGHRATLPGRLL
jgi:hypothetical protein